MKIKKYDSVNGWVQQYPEVNVGAIVVSTDIDDLTGSTDEYFLRADGSWAKVEDSGNQFVNISGDTMTGDLKFTNATDIGVENASGNSWYRPEDQYGNTHIEVRSGKGIYVDADIVAFRSQTNTDRMRIDSAGNVGIGTTSPSSKLTINSGDLLMNAVGVNAAPSTDGMKLSGYGLMGNRGAIYVTNTNSSGDISFHIGGVHGSGDNLMRLDGSTSRVGIGTASPTQKLDVTGNIRASSNMYAARYYDLNDTAYYVDPASTSVMNSLNVQRLEVEGAIFDVETDQLRMPFPKGGFYTNGSGTVTGAIEITLPSGTHGNYSMISFFVDVYDYAGGSDGESFTLHLGGYVNGQTWTNTFSNIITGRQDRFFQCRFNVDGTANKIYIGETTSSWAYPKIQIRDLMAGHSGADDADWYNNPFTIDITTTMDGTVIRNKQLENIASWADQVDVNSSSSTSYYNVIWHSGDTIYYAANNKLRVQPSTGNLQIDGDDVATQSYVDLELAQLVASAPSTLDTLNELAAALGDDPNFATTVTNSIATKLPLAGGTMTGTLTASGGINGLTISNGISGSNFNITGVNELQFNDPGEGIRFMGGSSGTMDLKIIDDGNDNILNYSGTGAELQVNSDTVWHNGNFEPIVDNLNVLPAYSNNSLSTVSYNITERAIELKSASDNSIGCVFPALKTESGVSWKISFSIKASASSTSGAYFRIQEYDGALPDGKTHIAASSTNSAIQTETRQITSFHENQAIGTSWEQHSFIYTPTSTTSWFSPLFLNWTGLGTNALYIKNLRIFAIQEASEDANTLDGINSTQFLRSDQSDTTTGTLTISNTNPVLQLTDTNTSGSAYIDYQGGTSLKVHAGSDPIAFIAGNSEKARITASGNVGIGTTSPTSPLTVAGTIESLAVNTTEGGDLRLRAAIGKSYRYTIDNYSDNLRFIRQDESSGGNGQVRMFIDSAGKVGIGTTGPSYGLDVYANDGEIRAYGTTAKIWAEASDAGQASFELKNTENHFRIITDNGSYIIYDQTDGAERFRIDTSGNQYTYGNLRVESTFPRIYLTDTDDNSDYSIINANGTFSIYDDTNSAYRMRINSSGNVGIGTDSPAEKLEVVGKVRASENFEKKGSGGYYLYNSSMGFRAALYDNGSATSIYGDGNGSTPVININSDNVGIGTTSPDEKLHIEGNILVDAYNNNPGDSGIFFREGYTASQPSGAAQPYNVSITLYDGANGGASYDGLAINGFDGVAIRTNNDSTPKMVISKDGDVGIGASSQAAIYHDLQVGSLVSSTTIGTIGIKSNGSGYAIFMEEPGSGSESYAIGVDTAGNLNFYNSGSSTPAVRFMDNDNVGIGVASPSEKLEVNGKVVASNGRLGSIESNGSDVDKVNFQLSGTTLTITTS